MSRVDEAAVAVAVVAAAAAAAAAAVVWRLTWPEITASLWIRFYTVWSFGPPNENFKLKKSKYLRCNVGHQIYLMYATKALEFNSTSLEVE